MSNIAMQQSEAPAAQNGLKSCHWVNNELLLGYNYIAPCCTSLPNGHRVPVYISEFASKELSPSDAADKIMEARSSLIRQLQVSGHPGCDACVYLKSYRVDELASNPYTFSGLVLTHIENCTLKCAYCYQANPKYNRNKPKQLYSVDGIIRDLLKRGLLNPRGHAFWGGGEPTIGDDFEDTVSVLAESGFSQSLNTNGVAFSAAARDALSKDSRFELVCSVDAGTRSTYSKIKGFDVYDRVMTNLAAYAATGGNVFAKFIFLYNNRSEALSFAEQALEAGVRNFLIDFDNGCFGGVNPKYHDEMFSSAKSYVDRLKLAGAAVQWAGHSRSRMTNENISRIESFF